MDLCTHLHIFIVCNDIIRHSNELAEISLLCDIKIFIQYEPVSSYRCEMSLTTFWGWAQLYLPDLYNTRYSNVYVSTAKTQGSQLTAYKVQVLYLWIPQAELNVLNVS